MEASPYLALAASLLSERCIPSSSPYLLSIVDRLRSIPNTHASPPRKRFNMTSLRNICYQTLIEENEDLPREVKEEDKPGSLLKVRISTYGKVLWPIHPSQPSIIYDDTSPTSPHLTFHPPSACHAANHLHALPSRPDSVASRQKPTSPGTTYPAPLFPICIGSFPSLPLLHPPFALSPQNPIQSSPPRKMPSKPNQGPAGSKPVGL